MSNQVIACARLLPLFLLLIIAFVKPATQQTSSPGQATSKPINPEQLAATTPASITLATQQEIALTQTLKPIEAPKCTYNNKTYTIGSKWQDDCVKLCECISAADHQTAIAACWDRCPSYKDPPGQNCTLVRSQVDMCCLEFVCTDTKYAPETSQQSTPTVSTSTTAPILVSATTTSLNQTSTTSKVPQPSTTTASPTTTTTSTTTTTTTTTSTTRAPITTTRASSSISKQRSTLPPVQTTTIILQQSDNTPASSLIGRNSNQNSVRNPKSSSLQRQIQTTTIPMTTTIASVAGPSIREQSSRMYPLTHHLVPNTMTTQSAPITDSSDPDEVDPTNEDLCILSDTAYRLHVPFSSDCNQTCECVFRSEPRNPYFHIYIQKMANLKQNSEQTELRCSLPPDCNKVTQKLVPTKDCPRPVLVRQSSNQCVCPLIECSPPELSSVVFQKPTTKPELIHNQGCKLNGNPRILRVGEIFFEECHSKCVCTENGEIKCHPLECPPPPNDPSCKIWGTENLPHGSNNSSLNTDGNQCCPKHECKVYSKPCLFLGHTFEPGDIIPHTMTSNCNKDCICDDGVINCNCTNNLLSEENAAIQTLNPYKASTFLESTHADIDTRTTLQPSTTPMNFVKIPTSPAISPPITAINTDPTPLSTTIISKVVSESTTTLAPSISSSPSSTTTTVATKITTSVASIVPDRSVTQSTQLDNNNHPSLKPSVDSSISIQTQGNQILLTPAKNINNVGAPQINGNAVNFETNADSWSPVTNLKQTKHVVNPSQELSSNVICPPEGWQKGAQPAALAASSLNQVLMQRNTLHAILAFAAIMTIANLISLYMLTKKSTKDKAKISTRSAYDNPTFTKLVPMQ